jgi:hypothetical protein
MARQPRIQYPDAVYHVLARGNGGARRANDLSQAERLLSAGLAKLGVDRNNLQNMPKASVKKQLLAHFLRTRTSVSNAWLSENLSMGHATAVSNGVRAIRETSDRKLLKRRAALATIGR